MNGFPYKNLTTDVSFILTTPDGTEFTWEPGETLTCHERLESVPGGLCDMKPYKPRAKSKKVNKDGVNSKTSD